MESELPESETKGFRKDWDPKVVWPPHGVENAEEEKKKRATIILDNYQLLMKLALLNDQVSPTWSLLEWKAELIVICLLVDTCDAGLFSESRGGRITHSDHQELVQAYYLKTLVNNNTLEPVVGLEGLLWAICGMQKGTSILSCNLCDGRWMATIWPNHDTSCDILVEQPRIRRATTLEGILTVLNELQTFSVFYYIIFAVVSKQPRHAVWAQPSNHVTRLKIV